MIYKILSIFIGGGLGAIFRFFASALSKKYFFTPIFGTFFVNVLGCFLIGLVFGIMACRAQNMPEVLKLFITVGFLGGLTTFSTFNFEIFELINDGKIFLGLIYMALSCFFGLLFAYFGCAITQKGVI